LAAFLLMVLVEVRGRSMKWIEPLDRFVEAIVILWLLNIFFKPRFRSSKRLVVRTIEGDGLDMLAALQQWALDRNIQFKLFDTSSPVRNRWNRTN
jgi:hypothetical protein